MDFSYSLLGRRDVELLVEQLKRLGVTKVVDPMAGTGLRLGVSLSLCKS